MQTSLLVVLYLLTHTFQTTQECGRNLPLQKPLTGDASKGDHPTTVEDSWILTPTRHDDREFLLVFVPRTRQYFLSRDAGEKWIPVKSGAFSTWTANSGVLRAPSNPRIMYKQDFSSGTYLLSTDDGHRWKNPSFTLDESSSQKFSKLIAEGYHLAFRISAIDPINPLKLYGTVQLLPNTSIGYDKSAYEPGTLYVSVDGGDSWRPLRDGFRNGSPIGISPSRPSRMYGISPEGQILKSDDSAQTWETTGSKAITDSLKYVPVNFGNDHGVDRLPYRSAIRQIVVAPTNENIVYIVSSLGILRSIDGGREWHLLDLGFDELDSVNSITFGSSAPFALYVGTLHGLFVSRDGGCTFTKIFPRQPTGVANK